ncbi:hypothetical protein DFH06DRAFT_1189993 [Mycena polygramma]|nr:hypothetical protein DFH06DRAFT_1189993 [Mycena polygramma]
MSFVSNEGHLALGNGVYNNVHGNLNNIVYNYYGRTSLRQGADGSRAARVPMYEPLADAPDVLEPVRKRPRWEKYSEDGLKIIQNKHLKLTLEIGSGPGYFLHSGETKGRAVIVKVFNPGPTVREQMEWTIAVTKPLLHPNVLRIEGVSSPASLTHFIAYENACRKTADGPLATALQEDRSRSITLGFKMVAGLASGINHLHIHGISLEDLGVQQFNVFLDVDDRFLISINPPDTETTTTTQQPPQRDASSGCAILNLLCETVLRSANRLLHNENIERNSVIPDTPSRPPILRPSSAATAQVPPGPQPLSSSHNLETEDPIPPRREYVWRTISIERGQQSLVGIATRITRDLDMKRLSSVNKLAYSDEESAHRCAGYIREEITLATAASESAVIFHDAPSPGETCAVCHEVVGTNELFRCICGDPNPGSRITVKCQICKFWSHRDCVGNLAGFICEPCNPDSDCLSPLDAPIIHPLLGLPVVPAQSQIPSPNMSGFGHEERTQTFDATHAEQAINPTRDISTDNSPQDEFELYRDDMYTDNSALDEVGRDSALPDWHRYSFEQKDYSDHSFVPSFGFVVEGSALEETESSEPLLPLGVERKRARRLAFSGR